MDDHRDLRKETVSEEEREFDALIKMFNERFNQQKESIRVLNTQRMREFVECESVMRRLFRGSGAKIEVIPYDGDGSIGVIRILVKEINIKNPNAFVRAARLASNYEVYPRTDGKLMLAFTFYGMTRKVV